MKKPDFFIVGAPRCGTSSMNAYLNQHPEIFMGKKESHFFALDLNSPRFIKDLNQYLALFSEASHEKRIGEASVMYLYSQQAAENIKKFAPEANIIIMLRNPVDLLYSLHSHNLAAGIEDILDFETALNAEEDRKQGLRFPQNSVHLVEGLYYREIVKFTQQVKRYTDVFGKEKLWVIIYDDLKSNTEAVYRATLKFLGVSSDFIPKFEVHSPNKVIRNHTLINLTRNRHIQLFRSKVLPSSLDRFLQRALTRLNIRYAPRPPMVSDLRKRLHAEFATEIQALSELLSRDLSHWCSEGGTSH